MGTIYFILNLNLGSVMIYIALATLSHILYGRSMVYSSNDVRFLPEDLILYRTFGIVFYKVIRSRRNFRFKLLSYFLFISKLNSIANFDFKFMLTYTHRRLYVIFNI